MAREQETKVKETMPRAPTRGSQWSARGTRAVAMPYVVVAANWDYPNELARAHTREHGEALVFMYLAVPTMEDAGLLVELHP